jgi:hypothetical protein
VAKSRALSEELAYRDATDGEVWRMLFGAEGGAQ